LGKLNNISSDMKLSPHCYFQHGYYFCN